MMLFCEKERLPTYNSATIFVTKGKRSRLVICCDECFFQKDGHILRKLGLILRQPSSKKSPYYRFRFFESQKISPKRMKTERRRLVRNLSRFFILQNKS